MSMLWFTDWLSDWVNKKMIDLAYCHNSESHIWLNNTIYSHEKPLTKFLTKSLILQSKKLLFWQQICWVPDNDTDNGNYV